MSVPLDQQDIPGGDKKPDQQPEQRLFGAMPFLDHLEELRRRLLKAAAGIVLCAALALYFSDTIMHWFLAPLGGVKLHVTEVTGSFTAYIKVALLAGLLASLPWVFYQFWAFISPGLYRKEKRLTLTLVGSATVLFLGGALFCYYLVLPWSLKFMIEFAGDLLSPIITVGSYLTFAGMLMIGFGAGFELPVVAYILGRFGVISSKTLTRGRRIAIVAILIVAAVLTPTPDIFTQMLLAVPLYVLYEISIVVVRVSGKKG